jgi:hypothetical protein
MTIHYPDDAAIARIGAALIDRTLPKAEWTHAAHFGATLWLLRHRPDVLPERDMPGFIRGYNASVGGVNDDMSGYHETITQASIAGARALAGAQPADLALHLLLDRLLASELGNRDWLLAYWTRDRLFSVAARRGWMAPDIASLPWPINPRSA